MHLKESGARGKMESGALYLRRLRLEDNAVDELEGERLEANPSRQAHECCS